MKLSAATVVLGAALIAAGVAGGAAWSQTTDGMSVVKNRQATMKRQAGDLKAIKDYLDGKADLAKAQAAGADLTQTTRRIPTLFPQATGLAQYPGKSGAKPAIWTDWNKFIAAQENAVAKADALSNTLKSADKAAISAAFGDLGKNGCGGCHSTFREKI